MFLIRTKIKTVFEQKIEEQGTEEQEITTGMFMYKGQGRA